MEFCIFGSCYGTGHTLIYHASHVYLMFWWRDITPHLSNSPSQTATAPAFYPSLLPPAPNLVYFQKAASLVAPLTSSAHLDYRPRIHFLRPHLVVDQADKYNRPRDQDSVIHIFRRDRPLRRPKAKEYDGGQVNTSEGIVCYTPVTRYMPRTPPWLLLCHGVRSDGRKYRPGIPSI